MRLVPTVLLFVGFISAVVACDHWPGVSKGDGPENPGNPVFGTCSGTPLPCAALSGADCTANSGCQDFGSCMGTNSESGPACGAELSYQGCVSLRGCFWASKCNGTPFGTCSAATESACLVAKGCVFTPAGAGGSSGDGGGSGSGGSENVACDTFGATCKSDKACGCFLCVSTCATCRSVCGVPCLSDFDCAGASDNAGTLTLFCVGAPATAGTAYTGICAATR
jgi:hypothetical protein